MMSTSINSLQRKNNYCKMTEKHKGCVHHAYSKIGWVVAFCGCDHVSIMTMKIEKVYQRWEVHYSGSGKMNPV